jgi:hypothetical protein
VLDVLDVLDVKIGRMVEVEKVVGHFHSLRLRFQTKREKN